MRGRGISVEPYAQSDQLRRSTARSLPSARFRRAGCLLLLLHAFVLAAPQGSVSRGPLLDPRNPELERAAHHNLDVARFYIKRKKWKAAEGRLQAIVRDHPAFSRIAEVYFLLGEVYRQTGRRDLAIELYSRVVEEFPEHEFASRARERLRDLGAPAPRGG